MFKALKGLLVAAGDFMETFLFFSAILVVFYFFFAIPHEVVGDSMLPNFVNGEHLLTNKILYSVKEPQRGDVVTFKFPKAPQFDYIKRIVVLPEEQIMLKDNKIYIYNKENPEGFVLNETYLPEGTITAGKSFLPEGKKVLIPKNNYITFGDNRSRSSDSREWGFVPRRNLIGKAWVRYWPPKELGLIKNPTY